MITLISLPSCNHNVSTSNSEMSSSTLNPENFKPFLFSYGEIYNGFNTYVIGGYNHGAFYSSVDLKFNGKEPNTFPLGLEEITENNLIEQGNIINLYQTNGEKREVECGVVNALHDAINGFHIITKLKMDNETKYIQFGLDNMINPFPREPVFSLNSISVDLDDDGTEDLINWTFTPSTHPDYIKGGKFYDLNCKITINGYTREIYNNKDRPVNKEDTTFFIADLDGNGIFEILYYTKAVNIVRTLTIYRIIGNQLPVLSDNLLTDIP